MPTVWCEGQNRFGTTMEVGLFEMTGEGLQPIEGGGALLDTNAMPRPGTVAAPCAVWLSLFAYRSPRARGFGLFGLSEAKGHGHRCQPTCDGDCGVGTALWFAACRPGHLCRRERGLLPNPRRICLWPWRLPVPICENPSLRMRLRLVNWVWAAKFVRSRSPRSDCALATWREKDFLRLRHAPI